MAMSAFTLESMFEAVYKSVVDAVHTVQDASWENTKQQYFDQDSDGNLVPKTARMTLPHMEDGKLGLKAFDIPLLTLAKHQTITVDEMTMAFDVELRSLDKADKEQGLLAAMPRGFISRYPTAKVTIKFKGGEPCEGLMLLNDKAHSVLPR
jgi:hypothetical protein